VVLIRNGGFGLINGQRLLAEFMEIVKIDSETGEERAICDWLIKKLTDFGLEVEEDDSAKMTGHAAGNLIVRWQGSVSDAPMIHFSCHMDTVVPGKGIHPSIQDGYIISDGTTILGSDDKAGLAALLEGIKVMQEHQLPHPDMQLIITVGEEAGLMGARYLDRGKIKAKYGFALDASGPVGEIIASAPSQVKVLATIHGRSAHAGVNPEDGISAIQVASRAISNMKLGRIDEETTANIGKFQGGTASNVVPERVEMVAEARSHDEAKLRVQVEHMVETFYRVAEEHHAKAEVTTTTLYPAFKFTTADEVVQKAMAAIQKVGRKPRLVSSGGGSDANMIASLGIPTVNLGIGYENIHTTGERMPMIELIKTAELVVVLSEVCARRS
jgi:tripeptide aminopeptidase